MRLISLGTIVMPARGGQPSAEIGYAEVLREVLFAGGRDGLATPQLMASMDVWDRIKAAGGRPSVLLEEAEWKHLCARLEIFRWGVAGEEAAQFVRAVREAAVVDPNAEPKE